MAAAFNPYHKWLGIPPGTRTVDYYRLLGIPRFERDADVIRAAAEQRAAHLAKCMSGENGELAKKLRGQVVAAAACLLDPQKRSAYDTYIRDKLSAQTVSTRTAAEEADASPVEERVAAGSAVDIESLFGDETGGRSRIRRKKSKSKSKSKSNAWTIWAVTGGTVVILAAIAVGVAVQSSPDNRQVANREVAENTKPTAASPESSAKARPEPTVAEDPSRHRFETNITAPTGPSSGDDSESRPSVPDRGAEPALPRIPRSRSWTPVPGTPGQPEWDRQKPEPNHAAKPAPKTFSNEPAKPEKNFPKPPEARPAGVSPQEFLEKYGLVKYGRNWVLEFEKTLREQSHELAKLNTDYPKVLKKAKAARRALQQAQSALDLAKKDEENLLSGKGILDGDRISDAQKQVHDAEAKRTAANQAANDAWAEAESCTKEIDDKLKVLEEGYEDSKRQYASLADAPAILQAIKDFNADLDKPLSLGPTAFFRNEEGLLKGLANLAGSTRSRIPYHLTGELRYVSVELNGKKKIDMAVDTGAEIVSLSWQVAIDAGLDPSKGERIQMGDASGGVSVGYRVVIPHVRVGKFVVDDVECVVSPDHPGREIPLLLGQSFLKRFNYQFDTTEQTLILSDATQGGK